MTIFITTSENSFEATKLSSVLIIDLIVFIILIGFLIIREFLNLYFVQYSLYRSDTKPNMGRLLDIAIIPFFYIFFYVLIFRLLNMLY